MKMRKHKKTYGFINVLCIVQARMGSTRLPGKVLKKIAGMPVLAYVLEAAKNSHYIPLTKIIVPLTEENKPLIDIHKESEYFAKDDILAYDVPENDVLSRYYKCYKEISKNNRIDNIVRITSDCPLLAFFPHIIDSIIYDHCVNEYDYSWNRHNNFMPSGLDVEVFKTKILEEMYLNIDSLTGAEKEHVTLYIRNNKDKYNILNQSADDSNLFWSDIKTKLSIDTKEDFEKISDIINLMKVKG